MAKACHAAGFTAFKCIDRKLIRVEFNNTKILIRILEKRKFMWDKVLLKKVFYNIIMAVATNSVMIVL